MGSQSPRKKLKINKERLRNLTADQLRAIGGGNAMDGDREQTAEDCAADTASCAA